MAKILLLEDDTPTRLVLEAALRKDGHELRSVGRLCAALPAAAEFAPEVLIADWLFPEGSVLATISQLRTLYPAAPIVFISGLPSYAFELAASTVSPVGILEKPFSLSDIRQMVRDASRVFVRAGKRE